MRYVPGLLLAFAVLAAVAPAEEISSEEVADLLDELVDRDPYVRKLAEKRLRELGPLVVPDLIEALSGKKGNVRIASARVLGAIGPKAKGAVPALVRATEQRTDAVLRHQAALALEKIDPDGAVRAPGGTGETSLPPESTASPEALIPLLASKDPKTRLEAARALGELGPKAKTAVPALLAAGDEGDPNVARAMLSAIGRIAPKDPAAVRAVWGIAQKGPTDRRRAALGALASIGEPAAEVVFSDYARTAHRTAPEALWTIGARAIPVLVSAQGLSSDAKETSIAACRALGFLGTNGAGAVPRLVEALQDKRGAVRRAAAEALGSIGAPAVDAVKPLLDVYKDPNSRARVQAALALGAICQDVLRKDERTRPVNDAYAAKVMGEAIEAGLQWLAAHQDRSGAWNAGSFSIRCPPGDTCGHTGSPNYTTGVTGLAVLSFLKAGYVGSEGETHAEPVWAGLSYLVSRQTGDGCFGSKESQHYVYNHGIATLALCEAWLRTRNPTYRGPAQRGLDFIAAARNPDGAWRYGIRTGDNDTSVTGWMVHALRTGELGNLHVDLAAYDGSRTYLDKVTSRETGAIFYRPGSGVAARPGAWHKQFGDPRSQAMTAVGAACRILLGEDARSPLLRKSAALCVNTLPAWKPEAGDIDLYYTYYGTLALYQAGGSSWTKWRRAVRKMVLEHQRIDEAAHNYGSWDAVGPWGVDGGRVYTTAILLLSLETAMGYERLHERRRISDSRVKAAHRALQQGLGKEADPVLDGARRRASRRIRPHE